MNRYPPSLVWLWCGLAALVAGPLGGQQVSIARALVTASVDASKVAELSRANVSLPDRGAVEASAQLGRVMMMLNRPTERGAALEAFLSSVQTSGNASYHKWLTPDEFGQEFGPADSDVAAVTSWLQSQGLKVESVSRGKGIVSFSGTVGQFNQAFSTRLDRFAASDGSIRVANATAMHVPEALKASIASVWIGAASSAPATANRMSTRATFHGRAEHPQWTLAGSTTPVYALAPADLATQYDLGPLYTAGIDGAGTTVGIIGDSNINAAEVDTFRALFGVIKGPVQVIVDGADPGTLETYSQSYGDLNDDPTVSSLGVETAGGVAPGAQIRLYISAGSEYQDPLADAALRAVDDDQADVLSLGYSECESKLGYFSYKNLFSALWEQAAAQGQTVVVAAGYTGSAGCGSFVGGNAANGLGSTPWNLSVGGTDFYYSDHASGGASAGSLWNQASDAVTKASLKAPLPEQVWNDGLGLNTVPLGDTPAWAGGGAPSSCGIFTEAPGVGFPTCVSGWPKPAWQSGTGIPQDGVRDTPDVSLFAGDGQNFSAYAVCVYAQDCVPDANGDISADLVGGTSAAAPAMAGIMALVDQKYGRQGQAAPVFYALAKTTPSVFHDVTLGGNQVSCLLTAGAPNCVANANGTDWTPGFPATAGYDLASGLGSIDAAVLVNHWTDVSFKSTSTSLQLSSASFPHGQSVTASVKVASSDGGTPTGDVALTTTSSLSAQQGQGFVTLQGGTAAEGLKTLPGGSYQLVGRYGGDGVYGASSSPAVSLTVTPEASVPNFQIVYTGHYYGYAPLTPGSTVGYGSPLQLVMQPSGASGSGKATGTATFALNATTFATGLNAGGYGSWTPQALPVGSYTASASYSGDASFSASSSASPLPFSIVPAIAYMDIDSYTLEGGLHQGDTVSASVTVGSQQLETPGTVAPTGQVDLILGDCGLYYNGKAYYQQTLNLAAPVGTSSTVSSALFSIPNVGAGSYCLRALYSGDAKYESNSTVIANEFTVSATSGVATTTGLQITPTTIVAGQKTVMIATVSGPAGSTVAPTGSVSFYDNGSTGNGYYDLSATLIPQANGTSIAELTQDTAADFFNSGSNSMVASYSGDGTYSPSTSVPVILTATQPGGDFQVVASQTAVTLAAGKSSTVALNLTALLGFTGTVNLSCASSTAAATCSISPASVALTNLGTATLSFEAFTTKASSETGRGTLALAAMLLVFLVPRSRRRWRLLLPAVVAVIAIGGISGCGSGGHPVTGGGGGDGGTQPTAAGSYTIEVNATSGNIRHEVTVLVTIQ